MIKFYLVRLEKKLPEERQDYLDTTVVAVYRDDVRTAWNEAHPEEELQLS